MVSSLTKEAGRIVRIVPNKHIRGDESQGFSFVVAVPAASPTKEQLWNETDVIRSDKSRSA